MEIKVFHPTTGDASRKASTAAGQHEVIEVDSLADVRGSGQRHPDVVLEMNGPRQRSLQ